MKFLLDQDVPEDVTYLLRELTHEVVRLRDVLPPEATDPAVLQFAHDFDCLLMTCDRNDFLKLAETEPHRGTIVVIRRKTRAQERAALLRLLERAAKRVSATTSTSLEKLESSPAWTAVRGSSQTRRARRKADDQGHPHQRRIRPRCPGRRLHPAADSRSVEQETRKH